MALGEFEQALGQSSLKRIDFESNEQEQQPDEVREDVVEEVKESTQEEVVEEVVEEKSEVVSEDVEQDTTTDKEETLPEAKEEVVEEVTEQVVEDKPTEEVVGIHPSLKELNDKLNDGSLTDLQEYIKLSGVDYSTMNAIDVVDAYWRHIDPETTDEEIDFDLDKYEAVFSEERADELIENGELTERKLKSLKIEWGRLERKARAELTKVREEKMVELSTPQAKQEATPQKFDWTEYQKELNTKAKNVGEDVVTYGEGKEFKFKIDGEDVKDSLSLVSEPDRVLESFGWVKDGKVDFDKMIKDAHRLTHFDKYISAATAQARSEGAESQVKDINNIDYSNSKTGNNADSTPKGSDAARSVISHLGKRF